MTTLLEQDILRYIKDTIETNKKSNVLLNDTFLEGANDALRDLAVEFNLVDEYWEVG